MTEELISIDSLQQKLDAINQSISERERGYYYLQSIDNFIYHLHSFSSERTQKRLAIKIDNYLSLLHKKLNEEHDLYDLAKQLFPEVWKISNDYKDELGFIKKPDYFFRLIFGVILFFILKSSFGIWVSLGCVTVLMLATTIYSEMKVRAKKYW